MRALPKKLLFVVFVALISFSFSFFIPEVKAATKASDSFFNVSPESLTKEELKAQSQDTVDSPQLYDYRVVNRQQQLGILSMANSLSCIYTDPKLCENQPTALGYLTQAIGTLYKYPPASGIAYTRDLLQNAGLIKPAFAQGIGFAGLSPLLPLWKASRNISYAILIIIMITIGFMVIFRMKIDPKTVISIQAALPKIVITLLLITFSYAIAGFFVDLMYLVMAIVIQVMAEAAPSDLTYGADFLKNAAQQQQEFMSYGFAGVGKLFTSIFSLGMAPGLIQHMFFGSSANVEVGIGLVLVIARLLAVFGGMTFAAGTFGLAFAIPVGILILILLLGLLFTFIRIFFLLLNSYIQLLMGVVLAPILLLKEAIPGQSAFAQWIQNIIANLVVFPATVGVIYFSWIFTSTAWSKNLWQPPMIPAGGGGDFWGGGNPLAIFIGMGIVFMMPNLVASIKKAFHPKPAIPVTAGSAFSPLSTAIGGGMGAMQSFYYFKMSAGGIPIIGKYLGGGQQGAHGSGSGG